MVVVVLGEANSNLLKEMLTNMKDTNIHKDRCDDLEYLQKHNHCIRKQCRINLLDIKSSVSSLSILP